jgi:hypothetical protein
VYSDPFSSYSERPTVAAPRSPLLAPAHQPAAPFHASRIGSCARRTVAGKSVGSTPRSSAARRSSKPVNSVLPPETKTSRSRDCCCVGSLKRPRTIPSMISMRPAWSTPAMLGWKMTSGTRMRSTFRWIWWASRWDSGSLGRGPRRKAWRVDFVQSVWASSVSDSLKVGSR